MKPFAKNFSLQEVIDELRKKYGQQLKVEAYGGFGLTVLIFLVDEQSSNFFSTETVDLPPHTVLVLDEKIL
jgi:hypothetical protein